jgi:hypothetical protein
MVLAASLVFTLQDNKGKSSSTKIHIPTTFSLSQMLEAGTAFAQLIANLSSAKITNVSLSVGVDLSSATIRAVAAATSDVFQKALLVAQSAVAGLKARFNIPTLDESKVIDGTDQIDLADADVAAVVTALEDGIVVGGVTITPRDMRGDLLSQVTLAREIFRKKSGA